MRAIREYADPYIINFGVHPIRQEQLLLVFIVRLSKGAHATLKRINFKHPNPHDNSNRAP